MKVRITPVLAFALLSPGCTAFKAPTQDAQAPTVATGVYRSEAERWAGQALADQKRADNAKLESDLNRLDGAATR